MLGQSLAHREGYFLICKWTANRLEQWITAGRCDKQKFMFHWLKDFLQEVSALLN